MSGSMGKSKSKAHNQSKQQIWDKQSPYLKNLYSQAGDALNDPNIQQSQDMMANRALNGNPLNFAAQNAVGGFLDGSTMQGSDYFKGQMQSAYNDIKPQMDSQFGLSGRSGSGLHAIGMEDRMMDAGAKTYANSLGQMMNAAQMAPQLANQDYFDIQQLAASPFAGLSSYQQLLGAPVTLGSSTGGSKSSSWNIAGGIG